MNPLINIWKQKKSLHTSTNTIEKRQKQPSTPKCVILNATNESEDLFTDSFGSSFFKVADKIEQEYLEKNDRNVTTGIKRCTPIKNKSNKRPKLNEIALNIDKEVLVIEESQLVDDKITTDANSKNSQLDNHLLSSWGLPECVLEKYHSMGITSMFQWQIDCLALGNVLNGGNLVYSAPTSAGKTLVAEILVLKRVLELRKKAIIILPFVSVAREKMFYLQNLFQTLGVRVDGFIGAHHPAGGWKRVDIAICTIEKANSLINRLLEEKKLHTIGTIVVDELHMLGDPSRGYLLELLLTKVKYMSWKMGLELSQESENKIQIQIIGMSATLPNLDLLARWLDADLFHTDFRPVPLFERIKIGNSIVDKNFKAIRELPSLRRVLRDPDNDNVIQLCLETVTENHSVLLFCPTKQRCESLGKTISTEIFILGDMSEETKKKSCPVQLDFHNKLRQVLNGKLLGDVLEQLKRSPAGLDSELYKCIKAGVAFHHAGLTFDERDIIEGAFRRGIIKVLCSTSTLSSGVNLPARRVIVRSPVSFNQIMDILTYRQMVGRAGRKGIDSEGESILICAKNEIEKAKTLVRAQLKPISSCLLRGGQESLSSAMKRAILEIIVSGIATSPDEVEQYCASTLLAASHSNQNENTEVGNVAQRAENAIKSCIKYLMENEFIMLHIMSSSDGTEEKMKYVPSSLGNAIMASSMSPDDGLIIFKELDRARKNFVLENELHIIYQVTPIHLADQWTNMDWLDYLNVWQNLSLDQQRVGELVGVEERFIIRLARNQGEANTKAQHYRQLAIHQRFYTALALQDLVNEIPLNVVARKYGCNRGMLQSLQQSASTFAGMVTSFCNRLGWINLELLLSQFQSRLNFGIQRELCDLVRLSLLTGQRARMIYNGGFETVADVANADPKQIETLLRNAGPFQSEKQRENETDYETKERKKARCIWLMGKEGYTEAEAAELLVQEARHLLQRDLGINIDWRRNEQGSSRDGEASEESEESNEIQEAVEIVQIRASQLGTNFISIPKNNENSRSIDPKATTSGHKNNLQIITPNKLRHNQNLDLQSINSTTEMDSEDSPDIIAASDDEENRTGSRFAFQKSNSKKLGEVTATPMVENIFVINSQLDKILDGKIKKSQVKKSENSNVESPSISPVCFPPPITTATSTPHIQPHPHKTNAAPVFDDLSLAAYMENYNTPAQIGKNLLQSNYNQIENLTQSPILITTPLVRPNSPTLDTSPLFEDSSVEMYMGNYKTPLQKNENLCEIKVNIIDSFSQSQAVVEDEIISNQEKEENNLGNLKSEDSDASVVVLEDSCETIESSQPIVSNKFTKILSLSPKNKKKDSSSRILKSLEKKIDRLDEKKCLTPIRRVCSDPSSSLNSYNKISDETMRILNAITDSDYIPTKKIKKKCEESPGKSTPKKKMDVKKILEGLRNRENWNNKFSDLKSANKSPITPRSKRKLPFSRRNRQELKKPIEEMDSDFRISDSEDTDSDTKSEHSVVNQINEDNCKNHTLDDAFAIIDVATDSQLFQTFIDEWRKQKKFSLSLACAKLPSKNPGQMIGAKIKQGSRKEEKSGTKGLEVEDKNVSVVGLSFVWEDRDAYFVSLLENNQNENESPSLCAPPIDPKLSISMRLSQIKKLLESRKKDCTIIAYDLKEHLKLLNLVADIFPTCQVEDPKVGVWLLDPSDNPKTLQNLVLEFCPEDKSILEHVGGTVSARSIGLTPETRGSPRIRSAVEAVIAFRVMDRVGKLLKDEKLIKSFSEIEMPSILLLCKMELNGLGFNAEEFRNQTNIIEKKLHDLELKAHQIAGRRFSLKSPAEIAKVLFGELGLNPTGVKDDQLNSRRKQSAWKRSKDYNTSKSTLQRMAKNHKLPTIILEHRKLASAMDNMILPLLKVSRRLPRLQMDRIFGISEHHTATGRVTMHEPNLQTVPRDIELVEAADNDESSSVVNLRNAFVAFKGGILLAADYSQLELRILAHMSQDSDLLSILNSGGDVFKNIAAQWKGKSANSVTDSERQQAKQICYGMIYGIGAKSLSEQLNVEEEDGVGFLRDFKHKYPGMTKYINNVINSCRENGYVSTVMGRRRYLPNINSDSMASRSQAERQAVNTTIQGSAADLAKIAMLRIDEALNKEFVCEKPYQNRIVKGVPRGASLVLQLHDELIYEVNDNVIPRVAQIIITEMENALKLRVQLPVKLKYGHSWGSFKEYSTDDSFK